MNIETELMNKIISQFVFASALLLACGARRAATDRAATDRAATDRQPTDRRAPPPLSNPRPSAMNKSLTQSVFAVPKLLLALVLLASTGVVHAQATLSTGPITSTNGVVADGTTYLNVGDTLTVQVNSDEALAASSLTDAAQFEFTDSDNPPLQDFVTTATDNEYTTTYTVRDGDNGTITVNVVGVTGIDSTAANTFTYAIPDYVLDTIVPDLTLTGEAYIAVAVGAEYTDAGAVTSDANATITSTLTSPDGTTLPTSIDGFTARPNTDTVGIYTYTYTVTDLAGNTATGTRQVAVGAPTLTLTYSHVGGLTPGSVTFLNLGDTLTVTVTSDIELATDTLVGAIQFGLRFADNPPPQDLVATATDNEYRAVYTIRDGDAGRLTFKLSGVTSSADVPTLAIDQIIPNFTPDTEPPAISLNGEAVVGIEIGGSYTDPGASTSDSADDIAAVVIAGPGGATALDPATAGIYTYTYTATDVAGNTAEITRTVSVGDITAPLATFGAVTVRGVIGTPQTVGLTFDEVVTGLTPEHFSGADDISLSGSGDTYIVTFTPTATAFTLTLAAASVTDASGNANVAASVPGTATEPPNTRPTFHPDTSAESEYAENDTVVIATYRATDAEGHTITWTISGADAGFFTIDPDSGDLTFNTSPDFESAHDPIYEVTVTGTDDGTPPMSVIGDVRVIVQNSEEPGSISAITGAAQVGQTLTAGTITDPDSPNPSSPVTVTAHLWQNTDGSDITGIANTPTYTPTATEVGKTIEVIVTYNDGHGAGKTVTSAATQAVRAILSTDANLSALALSAGTLPPFAAATTAYNAGEVANDVASITVTPTTNHAAASVTVASAEATSGTPSTAIPLAVGANNIGITVTAEDGTSTKTYTVTITRAAPPPANANLSGVVFTPTPDSITPAFQSGVYMYTVNVASDVDEITTTPTVNDASASLTVDRTMISSGDSYVLDLDPGINTLDVVVSVGALTETYRFQIVRALTLSANADLGSVTITDNNGMVSALNEAITADTTSYTATVATDANEFTVMATPDNSAALSVDVADSGEDSETFPFTGDSVSLNVVITAADGTTKAYTITVTRAADTTVPTVDFGGATITEVGVIGEELEHDITFSEGVTGLATTDFTVDGARITNIGGRDGDKTYTLAITPSARTFTITLNADSVSDEAGNTGPAENPLAARRVTGTAANQPPVAEAGDAQSVIADAVVTLDGSATDPDGDALTYSWTQTSGTNVTLNDAAIAAPTFTAPATAAVLVFELTVTDDSGDSATNTDSDTVTITVTAPPKPVIVGSGAVSHAENTETVAAYTATQNADGNPISVTWTRSGADADSFAISGDGRLGFANDPNYEDPQDADADNIYQITVTATDSTTSASSELAVTITVTNVDERGSIAAISGAVQAEQTLTAGAVTDPDSPSSPVTVTGHLWQNTDGSTITGTTDAATYMPTATEVGKTLEVIVTYTDGHGPDKTITSAATVAVEAADAELSSDADLSALTLSAGTLVPAFAAATVDYTAAVGNAVPRIRVTPTVNDATASVTVAGTAVASGRASAPIDLNVGANAIAIVVAAQDATEKTYTVTVTRDAPPNTAPTANAGADQSATTGTEVTLTGAGSSDSDGTIQSYAWVHTSTGGATPTTPIIVANGETSTFTAPDTAAELVFTLTVTDDDGATNSDTVTITVVPVVANIAPIANAGDDQDVTTGTEVTLTGAGSSDSDGTIQSYAWVHTSTGGATPTTPIIVANGETSTFTAPDTAAELVFTLTVTDDDGATNSDTVTITVVPVVANIAPIANAGDDQDVTTGTEVTLTGAGSSDSDGTIESYAWVHTSTDGGAPTPAITLSGGTTDTATFTPDTAAVLIFTLTVTDDAATPASHSATVTITVTAPADTTAPTVNFGTIAKGKVDVAQEHDITFSEAVTGLARGDFSSTGVAVTAVTVVSGVDNAYTLTLIPSAITFTLTLDADSVIDAASNPNAAATVSGTALPGNQFPIANAGAAQDVTTSATVTLDGSGSSDPDNDALTYSWTHTSTDGSAPSTPIIVANGVTSTFTAPDTAAVLVFTMSVTDGTDASTGTVTITVTVPAKPLIVGSAMVSHAENTETVATYTAAQDADGNPISVTWTRSGADADSFAISGDGRLGFANDPNFEDPQDTGADNVYQVTLIASTTNASSELEVTVTVTNADETGRIAAISGAVQAGQTLTAGAVTDPDSPDPSSPVTVTGHLWQNTDGSAITGTTDAATYMPTATEVGETLEVIVTYTDGHGPDKSVTSAATVAVLAASETLSSDADLSSLTLSAGALVPAFAADTVDYTAEVGNAVTRIRVTPTVNDATASVTVAGTAVASGATSAAIALEVGANTIDIVVAAQDGTEKTYTVTITRAEAPPANADLSGVVFTPTPDSITPAFQSSVYTYTVNVASDVESITITPTANDASASLTVDGMTAASGVASQSLTLTPGVNAIDVVVSVGALTETYRFQIFRALLLSSNADLGSVTITDNNDKVSGLNEAITAEKTSYTATVANDANEFTIMATPDDPNASADVADSGEDSETFTFTGDLVSLGVVITAQDATTKAYTVNVTRAADTTAPSVDFGGATIPEVGEFDQELEHDFTFNEVVTGLAITDFTVVGARITNIGGSGDPYTLAITPSANTFTITLNANSVTDLNGNDGPAENPLADRRVTGTAANQAPTAEAGADQSVTVDALVTLDGSATDLDGDDDALTYSWTQTSGTNVTLSSATAAGPTFTAPATAAVLIFELTVTDDSGDSATNTDTDTVTITVTAPPKPVIVGSAMVSHLENTETVATYTATQDADGNPISVTWTRSGADADSFAISGDGRLGFANDPNFEDPQDADADHVYQVTVIATDSTTRASSELAVTITVTNADETGRIAAISGAVQAGQTLTAGAVTDPDSPDPSSPVTVTGHLWQNTDGSAITGTTDAATYMPTATEVGETLEVIVTYTDGHGPDKSVTSAATVAVLAASETLSSDADLSSLTLSAGALVPAFAADTVDYTAEVGNAVTRIRVTPTVNDATASVTVAGTAVASGATSAAIALEVGANTIDIVVAAQDGTEKTYTVTVTRDAPPNTAPTANAGADQSATTGTEVTLTGAGSSDSDGTIQSYAWVHTSTGGATPTTPIIVANGETSTFTAPDTAAELVFTLTVTDDSGDSATNTDSDTVTITVTAPAKPVIVGSGAVSHFENTETVATYTAAQDADGNPISVTWTRSGADADSFAISGDGRLGFANDPNFEDPQDTGADNVYQITVIATDSTTRASSELAVTITVTNADETGRIAAISGAVQAGQTLTAGAVTDPDSPDPSSPVTVTGHLWQNTDGSTITGATDAATYMPTATEVGETLEVIVTYTDGHGPDKSVTSAATVAVLAASETLSADADLSSLTLSAGALVPAFAADTVDYTAEVGNAVTRIRVTPTTADTTASVTVAGTAVASGTASAAIALDVGANTIRIVVAAQDGTEKTYTVTVTRDAPPNTAPTVNAGPDQSVTLGANVILSGTATDPDQASDTLAYAWTQSSGTNVTLNDAATATAAFTAPDSAGALEFTLTVTDAAGATHAATVTITVTAPTPTDIPSAPTFTVTLAANSVSDGAIPPNTGPTSEASVSGTAQPADNEAPTAEAGAAQSVTLGANVILSGTATDPDQASDTLAYAWTQSSGTNVTLNDAATATATFIAPNSAGELMFTLTVTDAAGATHAATVTITVTAPTPTDTTPPTVAITHNGGASASGAFTATVTFSEPVTGFDINDVSVSAGTTGGFSGTDTTYMLTITPPANLSGSLTISVAARVAMDAAGNSNTAATQASVAFDTTTTTPETPEPPPPAAQSTEEMKGALGALGRALAQGVSSAVQGRFHAGPAAESFSQASLLDVWSVHPGTQGTLDLEQLLRGTEFAYALGAVGEDTPVTFWGSGEWRKLSGDPEVGGQRLDYDGDNYGVYVGVDALVEDTLLGVAMGYNRGSLDNTLGTGADGDFITLHPYMSVEVSPGVNIWGTFGYGKGEVEFSTGQNDAEQSGDATLWTGTVGVEGALQPVGVGDVVLSAAAAVAQTEAGAVETQTYWLRAEAEAGYRTEWGGGHARPFLLGAVRHDAGDAGTGTALEVGGGLELQGVRGLDVELRGRVQVNSTENEEHSVGGSLRYDRGRDGRGLRFSLSPALGATSQPGLDTSQPVGVASGASRGASLRGELGYGMGARGGLWNPFGRMELQGDQQRWSTGLLLQWRSGVEFELEAERRHAGESVGHGALFNTRLRF